MDMNTLDGSVVRSLPVLDKGEITLLDVMGDDRTVVNAARISFGKRVERIEAADVKLISYLAKNHHDSPFCHPQVQFFIKMPIFVARQWMRSGVGVRWAEPCDPSLEVDIAFNEESRRYIETEPEFYEPREWRGKAPGGNKQGSAGVVPWAPEDYAVEDPNQPFSSAPPDFLTVGDELAVALRTYKDRLAAGVAPEMARMCLPVSMYTQLWMTASLMACARMWKLRSHPHAQMEIKCYAHALDIIMRGLFPYSWLALTERTPE